MQGVKAFRLMKIAGQIIMPLIFFGYVCKESSIKKSSYQRTLKHNSYSWRQSSLASLISVSKLSVFI